MGFEFPTLSNIAGMAIIVLDGITIAVAIYRGHGVERTLMWIFAIVAIPAAGAIAYLALARPSIRRAKRRRRRTRGWVRRSGRATAAMPRFGATGEAPPAARLLHLAAELTDLPPTEGNDVELLTEDTLAFRRIEEAMRGAKRSIWAEYYIIKNDTTGKRFLRLLAEKAAEGVKVYLLYDAIGSLGLDRTRLEALRAAGGAAKAFLPFNPLRRRWSVHLRNHRKLIVVDGGVGFTGGMNVADQYSGRARRRGTLHYRDGHLAIRGPAVGQLAEVFAEDWAFATEEVLKIEEPPESTSPEGKAPQGAVVAVIPSGPDQNPNASSMTYFAGITSATKRLYLSTPFFLPDEPMLSALVSAALGGVDVRILVPAKNDVLLVGLASRCFYRDLVASGVRIFEYLPSALHSKTMVVDGAWGIVGSANMDIRSFRLNFELSAMVVDRQFAKVLEKSFLADLKDSREITPDQVESYGVIRRLVDGTAKLLSPLL